MSSAASWPWTTSTCARVKTGQIHALIGPNGAGKTTCFNLLTSFLPPTSGKIHFKGRHHRHQKPTMVARLGLIRSYHDPPPSSRI